MRKASKATVVQQTKKAALVHIASELGLDTQGTKPELVSRIGDALTVIPAHVSDESRAVLHRLGYEDVVQETGGEGVEEPLSRKEIAHLVLVAASSLDNLDLDIIYSLMDQDIEVPTGNELRNFSLSFWDKNEDTSGVSGFFGRAKSNTGEKGEFRCLRKRPKYRHINFRGTSGTVRLPPYG